MSSPTKFPFFSPEVRVVEASAGSGKTYALAKRYVQLVLSSIGDIVPDRADHMLSSSYTPIRSILALTFTNKAAFEMKARILEFLKKIAFSAISEVERQDIINPLQIDEEIARKRAFVIMESIIRNYNFFQVQTIDKFINAILCGCSFKLGLTANFKIVTRPDDYIKYSLDELLDKCMEDKLISGLFERFLQNYLYLENRSGWLPKKDMLSIMQSLFEEYNKYGYDFLSVSGSREDIGKIKGMILSKAKELRENLPEGSLVKFKNSLDNFIKKSVNGFDMDVVSDFFLRENFPVRKRAVVPVYVENLWQKLRDGFRKLCEKEATTMFNPYIDIFSYILDEIRRLSTKEDVMFLCELNKKAGVLFDSDYITVEEVYYRLASRFRHYLIDEFQDTNRLQWRNLDKMVEEALSTGGTLFYVGDKKQAIYRFRGGDVELFDDLKKRFSHFNIFIDVLKKNWRSQKAIVEFNNMVFSPENISAFIRQKQAYESSKSKKGIVSFTEEELYGIEEIFSSAKQNWCDEKDKGYVKIEYIEGEKKEEREVVIREKLIPLINNLLKRFSLSSIALLARNNSDVELLTSWLIEEGIAVESERTSNVKDNGFIQELVCLLRFLNSPIDNMSFCSFILGKIFVEISGISEEEINSFVFSLRDRIQGVDNFYVYREFRNRYPEQWERFISSSFKNVGLYPLYELVVSIYHDLDCLNRFPEQHGFFMHFLELIKAQEKEGRFDISSFLDYFENTEGEDFYVHLSEHNAIRILTFHKAKGLQFPVVIIPFLGMDVNVGSSKRYQQSYILRQAEGSLHLLRIKSKYYQFSKKIWEIYSDEYKKEFLSELNNVYVAMTRACYELYAFVPAKVGNKCNFIRFLIPEEIYEVGDIYEYKIKDKKSDREKKDSKVLIVAPKRPVDWIDYLKEEISPPTRIKDINRQQQGDIIHYALSLIGNLADFTDVNKIINEIMRKVRLRYPYFESVSRCEQIIREMLTTETMRQFFCIDSAEVFTEKELVDLYGNTNRIDRLVLRPSEVWVIDYKATDEFREEYFKQLRHYMNIVKEIYPERKLRGFLLYYEDFRVEEIKTDI